MSLIGPSIHACRTLKRYLLGLEGDKDVLDSILKPLIIQSPLAIAQDTNYENLNDSPLLNYEAINLFLSKSKYIFPL